MTLDNVVGGHICTLYSTYLTPHSSIQLSRQNSYFAAVHTIRSNTSASQQALLARAISLDIVSVEYRSLPIPTLPQKGTLGSRCRGAGPSVGVSQQSGIGFADEEATVKKMSGPINGSAEDQNDAGAVSVTRDETEGDEQADIGSDQDDADRGRSSERESVPTLVRPANTPVEPARIASSSVESQNPLVATYAPTYGVHYAEDIPHYLPQPPSSLRRAHTWHAATNDERGPQTLRSLHIDGRLTPPNQQVIFDTERPVKHLPTNTSTPAEGRKLTGLHETKLEKTSPEEESESIASRNSRHVCRERPCYTPATPENSCRSCISVPVVGDVGSSRLSRRPRGYTDPYIEKHREAINEHEYPETDEIWTNEIKRKAQQLAHEKGKAMRRDRDVSPAEPETVESEPAPQSSIESAGLLLATSIVREPGVRYTADNLPGDLGPNDPRRPSAVKPQPAPQPSPPTIENDSTPSVVPQSSSRPSPSSLGLDTQSYNPDGSDPTPYGAPGNRGKGRADPVNEQGDPSSASSQAKVVDVPLRQPSIAVSPLTARPNGHMLERISPPPSYQATQMDDSENQQPRNEQPAEAPSVERARLRVNQPPIDQQHNGSFTDTVPPPHNDSIAELQAVAPEPNRNIKGKEKVDDGHAPASTTDQYVFSLRLPESLFSESPRMLDTFSIRDLYHQQIVQAVKDDHENGSLVNISSEPPVIGDALTLWGEEANDPFVDRRWRDSVLSHWDDPVKEPLVDRRRRDSVLSNWGDPVDSEVSESTTPPHSALEPSTDTSLSAAPRAAAQGTLGRIWGALKDILDVVGGDDSVIPQPSLVQIGAKQRDRCRPGLFATGWGALRDALDNTLASV
ncbi:hypothetical protein LTR95_007862 [Oleoguttula sp. CCFEE 5521]